MEQAGRPHQGEGFHHQQQSINLRRLQGGENFWTVWQVLKNFLPNGYFSPLCWNMHKTGFEKLGGIPGVKCGGPGTKWNFLHHFASCTGLSHFDEHKPSDFFFLSPVMEMRATSWREKNYFLQNSSSMNGSLDWVRRKLSKRITGWSQMKISDTFWTLFSWKLKIWMGFRANFISHASLTIN